MQFKPHALAYKAPGGLAPGALSVLNLYPSSPCFLSSSYTDLLIPVPKHSSFQPQGLCTCSFRCLENLPSYFSWSALLLILQVSI